jgi:hypothetical protein
VILGHKSREAFKWASFLSLVWASFGKIRLFLGTLIQDISDIGEPKLTALLLPLWNVTVVHR